MSLFLVLMIVWLHFVGDFLLQTDKMATLKSTSVQFLTFHVLAYACVWFLFGWKFMTMNALLHWIIDFFTSRATKWAWAQEKRHLFFAIIGFDQALHLTCLFSTVQFAEYELLSKIFTGC